MTLPLVDATSKSVRIVAVAVANVEERVDDRVLTSDSLTVWQQLLTVLSQFAIQWSIKLKIVIVKSKLGPPNLGNA